jgi:hemerythrin-like domain-containing protein
MSFGLACGVPDRTPVDPRGHGRGGREHCLDHVTAVEDLMREHGVVDRLLLVYDEAASRLEHGMRVDDLVLESAVLLVRRFVEDYHAMLEEEYVFPTFLEHGDHGGLVAILVRQHVAARKITDHVLDMVSQDEIDGPAVASALRRYTRMLRPHTAREDTVLFPTWQALVGPHRLGELAEQFESIEHARLGGFEKVLEQLVRIERAFRIDDLDAFTDTQRS